MKSSILYVILPLLLCTSCSDKKDAYDASGIFETTEVIVSAKSSGEIEQFNVEEGQTVSPETNIGYIDTLQLSLKRRQLVAMCRATRSRSVDTSLQLGAIRQQIAIQEREKRRFENLVKADAANQKQIDDINYQIQVLQRQLAAQQEQLSNSNNGVSGEASSLVAQVAQIDDQIRNAVIVTPIAGTVLAKYTQQGEYATPGKPLFKVANVGDMKLRVYITADQLTTMKIGQRVRVFADQGKSGRKEYAGRVVWIADKAEFTPKTIQTRDERANLVYAVKVAVHNDGYIKEGMYGDIKL